MTRPFLLLTFLALAGGCAEESFDLPAGAPCQRSIQCSAGLACALGVCGNDPTDIGGTVPENPDVLGGDEMDASTP